MKEQVINTSVGPKSPSEALHLFKFGDLSGGAFLGIFSQLRRDVQRQAATYALENEKRYPQKVLNLARELIGGLPITPKMVVDESIEQLLRSIAPRADVRITFKQKVGVGFSRILPDLWRYIHLNEGEWAGLQAVALSGEWQHVPRTYRTSLSIIGETELVECTQLTILAVEKIELVSTLQQRVVAWDPVPDMLAKNPELFYDEGLFRETCSKLELLEMEINEWVEGLNDQSPMTDVVGVFSNPITRIDFLEGYIKVFTKALA